jgi:hypothetical protein
VGSGAEGGFEVKKLQEMRDALRTYYAGVLADSADGDVIAMMNRFADNVRASALHIVTSPMMPYVRGEVVLVWKEDGDVCVWRPNRGAPLRRTTTVGLEPV